MNTCNYQALMPLLQMKRLLWRHAIGLVQHLPAFGERHIGVAPLVEGGVCIAFTQYFSSLIHRYASLLRSHAIIEIAFAVRKVIIQIAQDMISRLRYQYNISIEIIHRNLLPIGFGHDTTLHSAPIGDR